MDYRKQILRLADIYANRTGRSTARIATLIHNQGQFFERLEEGKGCTVDTFLKALCWFEANWPEDLPWPEGVLRSADLTAAEATA